MSSLSTMSFTGLRTVAVFYGMQASKAFAQVFNGGGISAGVDAASGVTGVDTDEPRNAVIAVIEAALNYLALIAVAMIIIAGFYLVLSIGNDDGKEKAKKIIYYTVIGLVVILLSRIIVSLVTEWLPDQI
jgi:hypothetical protein